MEFLVGRDGEFDLLVTSVIRRCKREVRSDNSFLVWVLPYETAEFDLIEKIDDPVTESSKDAIEAARTAYDKLTADQKKLVTNYEKLTKAETELAKLVATEDDIQRPHSGLSDRWYGDRADSCGEVNLGRNPYLTDGEIVV